MNLKISRELFVIPQGGIFFLCLPLRGRVLAVNSGTIELLKKLESGEPENFDNSVVNILNEAGVLREREGKCVSWESGCRFTPTHVTIFPSSDCNLRCVYCYAAAGEQRKYISLDAAYAAVDLIAANALVLGHNRIEIEFHGGGEPFFSTGFEIVRKVVEYAGKFEQLFRIRKIAASNGVLSERQIGWILDNLDHIQLSLDGPDDIQNRQRPMRNGAPSFEYVLNTIRRLEKTKFSYGIRSTITEESVTRMKELVNLIATETNLKRVHLEPLFGCGRCNTSGYRSPDPSVFLKNFIEAREYAKKVGITIYYSGARSQDVRFLFCGAAGRNFCVTPEGFVSSCNEVTDSGDPRKKTFFYGHYSKKKRQFEFSKEKIEFLLSRTVSKIRHCADCFAKYSCAGDCLAKAHYMGDMFDTSTNERCDINRGVLLYELSEKMGRRVVGTIAGKHRFRLGDVQLPHKCPPPRILGIFENEGKDISHY
ncbi:MAG: radical SAM protein [Candidatus Helarchaeota archaeon]|nr:radical SAM protein [Candidatus Helarchaeota archaeon]